MSSAPDRSRVRLGWLATTLVLAAALVIGSWLNYRGARAAVATLNRGHADLLELAIREVVHPFDADVDSTELRAFLDAHADAGLRYVALLGPRGSVTVSAGEPAAPPASPRDSTPDGQREMVRLGGRVRAFFPRPPIAVERQAELRSASEPAGRRESSSEGGRGRDGAGGERRVPRMDYFHLLEFEPVVASVLVTRATQALVIACVGAIVLVLASLHFWRLSDRYAEALVRLEAQKRLTVLGEMSAVMAHEIRNPLASLKGHAQLLAERLPADSRERARAERVVGEASRLEGLTSDLLDFARSGPLEAKAADPLEVLRLSTCDVAEDGFEVDATEAPPTWTFDAGRVRQALVNVLQNARQASPVDRSPHVRVFERDGSLVYEVRDHGPGLPEGSETRIFDPFFTTRTNGTGLGLAVARRVAEMHGGRIEAHTHAEGGAIFRVTLPREVG